VKLLTAGVSASFLTALRTAGVEIGSAQFALPWAPHKKDKISIKESIMKNNQKEGRPHFLAAIARRGIAATVP